MDVSLPGGRGWGLGDFTFATILLLLIVKWQQFLEPKICWVMAKLSQLGLKKVHELCK